MIAFFIIQNPARSKGKKDKIWREAVRLQIVAKVIVVKMSSISLLLILLLFLLTKINWHAGLDKSDLHSDLTHLSIEMNPQNRQIFLGLLENHFPKNHRFHKIFNKNSVKVSYSCTKSMKTISNNHNKNIPGMKPSIKTSTCNCSNKEACALNGQCEIGEVVYECTI